MNVSHTKLFFLIVLFWKTLKYFKKKCIEEQIDCEKVLWIIAEREENTEYLSTAHHNTS